jgi:hypothetical protein
MVMSQECTTLTVVADSLLQGFVKTRSPIVFLACSGSRRSNIRTPNPFYTCITPALRYLLVLRLARQRPATPALLASIAVPCPRRNKDPSTLCNRRTTVRRGRPLVSML